MARYDFGLRGPRDTQDPRYHDWSQASRLESEHPHRTIDEAEDGPRTSRSYSRPTGDRYPRSSYRDGVDLSGGGRNERAFQHPARRPKPER